MTMQLRKAERRQAKLRVGLFGPSGSGKTMGALKIARGIAASWEKVAVIDTENGSADLYAHLGAYNVITLTPPFTPEAYIEAIKACEVAGVDVIVVDSITHEWAGSGGILEIADQLGKDAKNSYTVWAKITPRHNKFIDAILQSPCHIVCCGRSKQEYAMNQIEKNGKTISVPEKLGLKAITREGFDYEMTVTFELPISHLAISTKDRTGLFQDKPESIISEQHGVKLKEWSISGAQDPVDQKRVIQQQLRRLGYKLTDATMILMTVKDLTDLEVRDENLQAIIDKLSVMTEADKPKGPPEGPGQSSDAGAGKPPSSSPGAELNDKTPQNEAGGGNPTPPEKQWVAPTAPGGVPAAPAPAPKNGGAELLKVYSDRITAAKDASELDAVYGEIVLDKQVISSPVLDGALKGLVEKRMKEIAGVPLDHEPKRDCSACDGKGTTPSGTDCTTCNGLGVIV